MILLQGVWRIVELHSGVSRSRSPVYVKDVVRCRRALRERYCALDARLQRFDELDTCSSLVGSQPRLHARVKD